MPTYAEMSGGSGHAPRTNANANPVQNQRSKNIPRNPAPPRLVDPNSSIVVDKVVDPSRFADSLLLKDTLDQADSHIGKYFRSQGHQ